jgi:gluconolactonase
MMTRIAAFAPDTGSSSGGTRWYSAEPIRYPDPNVIVLDPRFQRIVLGQAAIERIATGFRFTEGMA